MLFDLICGIEGRSSKQGFVLGVIYNTVSCEVQCMILERPDLLRILLLEVKTAVTSYPRESVGVRFCMRVLEGVWGFKIVDVNMVLAGMSLGSSYYFLFLFLISFFLQ